MFLYRKIRLYIHCIVHQVFLPSQRESISIARKRSRANAFLSHTTETTNYAKGDKDVQYRVEPDSHSSTRSSETRSNIMRRLFC